MRPLITLALLGLLVCYVSGRAIMHEDESKRADSSSYDACMMKCDDSRDVCLKDCGNGADEEAVNCRGACENTYATCTTGSSSEDENIPYYKREVKRSCQDHVKRASDGVSAGKKDDIDYEFLLRQ